jgi:hypothetical protein
LQSFVREIVFATQKIGSIDQFQSLLSVIEIGNRLNGGMNDQGNFATAFHCRQRARIGGHQRRFDLTTDAACRPRRGSNIREGSMVSLAG